MAQETADDYLDGLHSLFTPWSYEFDAAKSHRASIEARLSGYLGIDEMFETGSLRHGTGVWRYSDADYIVALKGARPSLSSTALNRVKDTLQERFPGTTIAVRRPAVVCTFSDATVEIVPGYASGSGYWIADPLGGWMLTHPKQHNAYVNEVNKKLDGAAKWLARLAKVWKYQRSVPTSSCYLEMRAARYVEGESTFYMTVDLHIFLSRLLRNNLPSLNDPTGLGSRFNATSSDATRTAALSKLATAVSRAERAQTHALAGRHADAITNLKLLFNR